MATRFWLPTDTSVLGGISPAFGSAWGVTSSAVRSPLARVRTGRGATDRTAAETSATATNVLIAQFVSEPLAAQVVAGNWTAVVRGLESATGADASLQMVVRVVSSDGSTERGVVYAGHSAANNATVGALGEELGTVTATRIIPSQAGSSVTAQSGDRLVVELGYRAANVSATSFSGTLTFYDNQSADYALTSGLTATTSNPWVECSQDLVFNVPKLDTFVDNLDDYHSPPWYQILSGADANYVGGRLRLSGNVGSNPGLSSEVAAQFPRYDMVNSGMYIMMESFLTGTTWALTFAAKTHAAPENQANFVLDAATGNLILRQVLNGSVSDATIVYNATSHKWLRLRNDGAGNLLWDTSPDGTTWTNRRTLATSLDLTTCSVLLQLNAGAGPIGGYIEFDNMNVQPDGWLYGREIRIG